MNRRSFIKTTAAATAGFTIIKPNLLGGKNYSPPSDIINIGFIGCGTQGIRQLLRHITHDDVRITAVCDPNLDSTDYIEWNQGELRTKIRTFFNDQSWGEGIDGCRAGRVLAKEIVQRYYRQFRDEKNEVKCDMYEDYRDLLEDDSIDAVYIMTPDHHHANIAVAAMLKGKHVIVHKPLAISVEETRYVAKIAEETGVATHMFCSESEHSTPLLCEWLWDGAIGDVKEVHNWSNRPVWPQGWTEYPDNVMEVPEGFNWDIWLGPAEYRQYNSLYTHSLFRGWRDFGTGAMGDMGHYSFRQIFQMLKLNLPEKIEASKNIVHKIEKNYWVEKRTDISFPNASIVRYDFPPREEMPGLKLNWYDGAIKPPLPEELEIENRKMPREGLLLVGEKGKIIAGFRGQSPRIIPESKMQSYNRPDKYLERPIDGFIQWIEACRGGKPSSARFEDVAKLTETICLGNIALNFEDKLNYDSENMSFKNNAEADKYLSRYVRKGWEFIK